MVGGPTGRAGSTVTFIPRRTRSAYWTSSFPSTRMRSVAWISMTTSPALANSCGDFSSLTTRPLIGLLTQYRASVAWALIRSPWILASSFTDCSRFSRYRATRATLLSRSLSDIAPFSLSYNLASVSWASSASLADAMASFMATSRFWFDRIWRSTNCSSWRARICSLRTMSFSRSRR